MNNISEIRTLYSFQKLINECKLQKFNWKGGKCFSYGRNKTVSLNRLINKLDRIYRSECFNDAQLPKKDCEILKKIVTQIKQLDNQNIKISKLQNFYLKVIYVVKRIFSFGKTSKKDALMRKISTRAEKPSESALLYEKIVKTDLSDQVKDALNASYKNYYKHPYEHTHIRKREAVRTVDGKKIHKYNHGLAHTTRKVFFIPFIVEYLSRHGVDHLSTQLQEIIEKEGFDKLIQKLQLATIFEVAGRKSECGTRDDMKTYTSYVNESAKAFEKYCRKNSLVGKLFQDDIDLNRYREAIKNKFTNRFKKTEMDVITVILDMTHNLDLFRCYWPSRMKNELEEINHFYTKNKNNRDFWELANFCQKAVRVTGDRLMTEFSQGFNQRNRKFAHCDLTAKIFRNFSFTDENAFFNCSTDAEYCWELLKKIPPPISYSHGETTFSYLQPLSSEAKTKEIENPGNLAQEALEIISNGKGAIRLVNTKPEKFGFEMTMLNDPVFFRPVRPVKAERDWTVEDREKRTITYRGFKEKRLSLKKQIGLGPSKSGGKKKKAVHKDEDRGLPKYTDYTKKLSFTLLRPDGRIKHFTGVFPKEWFSYNPIGFLYNVDELHQKGQKYVFDKDVGTSSKFWIGRDAANNIKQKQGRDTNLDLKYLQEKLKNEVEQSKEPTVIPFYKMQHAANEMLMCPKKSAIKAVFATKNTLEARLRTFLHVVYLAQDYGVHVPALIIDGKNSLKAYTKKELKQDLDTLSSRSTSSAKKALKDLYSCFFSAMDNPDKKQLEDLLFISFDPSNPSSVASFL